MSINLGFDSARPNMVLSSIENDAFTSKGELVKAKTLQEFSLSGLQDAQIVQFNQRLGFKIPEMNGLGFDARNLLVGILAGDFQNGSQEGVRVYYQHIRDGQMVGKTVLNMGLDDAVLLAKKAAGVIGVDEGALKKSFIAMMTRFTLSTPKQFELHRDDISMALYSKI